MSGGCIVVLDRHGREVKRFPLPTGLATLGSAHACDIRVMLPSVSAHHASVVVHSNQAVVRNVSDGETMVNGVRVSVAALQHGDIIQVGGRSLRWEYSEPQHKRHGKTDPALFVGGRLARARGAARRATGAAPPAALARDPAVRLALEMTHRSSTPANSGGKQVAIVQPQRRDTNEQSEPPRSPSQASKRARAPPSECGAEPDGGGGRPPARASPLPGTTKASLWIESRKTSPRKSAKTHTPLQSAPCRRSVPGRQKSTPLRLTVLKRAQSARRARSSLPAKIQAPLTIDHTKQAAILLMTGHTPKSRLPPPQSAGASPSYLVRKGPAGRAPASRGRKSGPRRSKESSTPKNIGATPKRDSSFAGSTRRSSRKSPGDHTVPILEITDSEAPPAGAGTSRRSRQKSLQRSPLLPSPKKSALRDPTAKRSMRKTESIKFDLSNLADYSQGSGDVLMLTDTTQHSQAASEEDITLRYSDSSNSLSPSPRRSIHSRSGRMLQSLGTPVPRSPSSTRPLTPESPRSSRSLRGSIILQKALDPTGASRSSSRRSSRAAPDQTQNTSVASAFRTRTLSPRSPNPPRTHLESYSIVDLVSIDSNESGQSASVYNSLGSASTATFGTPPNSLGRKTRSTIDPALLSSSTPYVKGARTSTRSRHTLNFTAKTLADDSQSTARSSTSRRSKSLTTADVSQSGAKTSTRRTQSLSTPENSEVTKKHISVNSTKISRASKSRSRINESDLLLADEDNDDSPKSSRRASRAKSNLGSPAVSSARNSNRHATPVSSPSQNEGTITPENTHSPEEATTPVLSIQSLLDSSQSSMASHGSLKKGGRFASSFLSKRNTIGGISDRKTRTAVKSQSMNFTARKTRLRLSSDSTDEVDKDGSIQQADEEMVTPKSGVKLVQEDVKNKHSTAKKPHSKRSIIDDLNESDIVKQLFNSPVKRKLSQSMTEFSRKQLFDDDDLETARRPKRNTIALTGKTPENSLLDNSESFTPDRFVSPMNTPSNSPNLTGIKRLFGRNTPANDLRNVKGVKGLLRTPRTKKSIKNDLTNVTGVKAVFAKSPANRLSDVRVKDVFAASPRNDLRRVTGVNSLFHTAKIPKSPKNDLTEVRGVKKLFKVRSPMNDLGNVSGVKKTMRRNSPRNDLTDVRGVRRMFREEKELNNGLSDISGVEELFNTSRHSRRDADSLFDQLIGKPTIRAVYSKTFPSKLAPKKKTRRRKSLNISLDLISNNVEEWLEQELQKRLHSKNEASTSKAADGSKTNMTREMQKLATNTVEGTTPLRQSRVRNSTVTKSITAELKRSAADIYSAHTLPIKKRSLVEKSMDKTNDSKTKAIHLPIKKRVVIHSTPVKGRINMTMNASELSRVSPITVIDKTVDAEHYTTVESAQLPEETVTPKGRQKTKAKTVDHQVFPEFKKPSPRKTRQKSKAASPAKTKQVSPAKAKKGRLAKVKEVSPIKPKPTSPVQTTQASPPKPRTARNRKGKSDNENKVVSPVKAEGKASSKATKVARPGQLMSPDLPKTRGTRSRKNASLDTNIKKRRASLVVTKKTPVMSLKSRATRNKSKTVSIQEPVKVPTPKIIRATRKNANVEDKVKTPKNTRAKAQKAVSEPSPQLQPKATRRGRKPVDNKVESPEQTQVETKGTTRGKATAIVKQDSQESKPELKSKRGRKAAAEPDNNAKDIEEPKRKTRGKKVEAQKSVESEPSGRSRRAAKQDLTAPPAAAHSRKRKTTAVQEAPAKMAKSETRGRKVVENNVTEVLTIRQKRSVAKESKLEVTRQGSGDAGAARGGGAQKTTRGRQKASVVESAPEVGKRKRKPSPESSPAKGPGKKAGGKKPRHTAQASPASASASASASAPLARPARRRAQPEGGEPAPAGRSRRR